MTPGRAVAYIGGAVVLAAWLASAASTTFMSSEPQVVPRAAATRGTERLAAGVQAQSARLRQRLASAPIPQEPARNPFAFADREAPRPRAVPVQTPLAPVQVPPIAPAPDLSLAGIAEQQSPAGIVRTAIVLGAADEMFMVTEGQVLAGRYTVAAIGPDGVELKDSTTGATRRLVLR